MLSCVQFCATLCPWDPPGKNTGVGLPFPTPGDLLTQGSKLWLLHLLHWQADSVPLSNLVRPKQHSFDYVSGFCGPKLGQSLAGQFSVWPPVFSSEWLCWRVKDGFIQVRKPWVQDLFTCFLEQGSWRSCMVVWSYKSR